MAWLVDKLVFSDLKNPEFKREFEDRVSKIFTVITSISVVLWLLFIGFDFLFARSFYLLFLPSRILGAILSAGLAFGVYRKKTNVFTAQLVFYYYLMIVLVFYFLTIEKESVTYYFTGYSMVIVLMYALFVFPPKHLLLTIFTGVLSFITILVFNKLSVSETLGLGGFSLLSELIMMSGVGFYNYINFYHKIKSDLALFHAKKELEIKASEVIDSITYAKRLQEAILPGASEISEIFEEYFIIYRPKDIVAGDFYWVEKKESNIFLAAADCTGHGVPGAMVSMVCSNALSRCVHDYNITDTNLILDEARKIVTEVFGRNRDVKDGMDISLCRINLKKRTLQWSGANNPLWIFEEGQLTELKPDRQPVGQFDFAKPFNAISRPLAPNTTLYLFSDGICDQIGGPRMKKLKSTGFLNLIKSFQDLPLYEQKNALINAIHQWQNNYEQVDDILVIGVKL